MIQVEHHLPMLLAWWTPKTHSKILYFMHISSKGKHLIKMKYMKIPWCPSLAVPEEQSRLTLLLSVGLPWCYSLHPQDIPCRQLLICRKNCVVKKWECFRSLHWQFNIVEHQSGVGVWRFNWKDRVWRILTEERETGHLSSLQHMNGNVWFSDNSGWQDFWNLSL